jgi:hypothetical protein
MVEIASYGPWAVVTGASSGIGKAFAGQLAAAGLNLVLAARSAGELDALGQALARAHGISYRAVAVDLGDPGGAAALLAATGDLDVGLLVSNAGTGRPGRLLDQPLEDLHSRFTLNAVSHLDLVHGFGGRLVARGRGGIVLTSALVAFQGLPNMAHGCWAGPPAPWPSDRRPRTGNKPDPSFLARPARTRFPAARGPHLSGQGSSCPRRVG